MSFASLLTHPLAIVTPTRPDPGDVDERGHAELGPDAVVLVNGLVQPKTYSGSATEAEASHQAGVELSTHTVFLLPRSIGAGAWIRDHPDRGRRFDITGIRSYEFGTVPHLEVDVKLVGSTEGPGAGS